MGASHYVYAARCADRSIYVGYSTDPERRLAQHNAGKGARYARGRRPLILLRLWPFDTAGEALRFEHWLKRRAKPEKERIISEADPL